MAKFKQVPQTFTYSKLLEYWGNMVKNFDEPCRDDDFFDVARNCFDHDKAVELIEAAYTPKEIDEMEQAKSRCERLDLSDPLDDVFQALWNNEPTRGKCRAVLDAMRECMEADCKDAGKDVLCKRFETLKTALRLDELEAEILMFAYIRDQTCFCWPIRVEDREKPLYYAMALDRSFNEVSKAMSAQGKLIKFGLLDSDYDFARRSLGGFMDGTSDEPLERRFYAKGEEKDILPWSYFGELAGHDGKVLKDSSVKTVQVSKYTTITPSTFFEPLPGTADELVTLAEPTTQKPTPFVKPTSPTVLQDPTRTKQATPLLYTGTWYIALAILLLLMVCSTVLLILRKRDIYDS